MANALIHRTHTRRMREIIQIWNFILKFMPPQSPQTMLMCGRLHIGEAIICYVNIQRRVGTLGTWHKMKIALVAMPFAFKFSSLHAASVYYSSVCWGLCGRSSAYLQWKQLNGSHFVQSSRNAYTECNGWAANKRACNVTVRWRAAWAANNKHNSHIAYTTA